MLKNAAGILRERDPILYNYEDVEETFQLPVKFLEYNQTIEIEDNIKISFKNAGHILGSASVKIDYIEDSMNKSVVFSGDIGQKPRLITSEIDFWEKANYIFLESTYGASLHKDLSISVDNYRPRNVTFL